MQALKYYESLLVLSSIIENLGELLMLPLDIVSPESSQNIFWSRRDG